MMKAMEREKEELETEKGDLGNQFEALKLMVEPYRYCSSPKTYQAITFLFYLVRHQLESFEL